jgi:hypothetical protein
MRAFSLVDLHGVRLGAKRNCGGVHNEGVNGIQDRCVHLPRMTSSDAGYKPHSFDS